MESSGRPVSLSRIAMAMDVPNEDRIVYLERRTGELEFGNRDPSELADYDDLRDLHDEDDGPEAAGEPEAFLRLPSRFDLDEIAIMRDFCGRIADPGLRAELMGDAREPGVFGRFRARLLHCGRHVDWIAFRGGALRDVAAAWLDANGVAYRRD